MGPEVQVKVHFGIEGYTSSEMELEQQIGGEKIRKILKEGPLTDLWDNFRLLNIFVSGVLKNMQWRHGTGDSGQKKMMKK